MTASGRGRPPRAEDTTAATGLLTIPEAAQQAGVSRETVRSWIARGQLPSVRIDRRRRIHPTALAAARDAAQVRRVEPVWRRNPRRAGQRLRLLREAAGLNQQELAARSGLTHEEISRLELGHQVPLTGTVRAVARALGTEPGVFVGRSKLAPVGLTTAEAAARLDVPAGRVRTWLHRGLLAGTKVSGTWRVPVAAVVDLERRERLRGRSRRLDPRYRG